MDLIEQLDPTGFHEYLKQYQNTICGRHPIGVLLHVRFNQSVLYVCDLLQSLTVIILHHRLLTQLEESNRPT